jgi:hypothetical protein
MNTSPPYLWILLAIVGLVFMVTLALTANVRGDHTYGLSDASYRDCMSRQMDESIRTGAQADLNCEGTPPWYAESPFFSAAIAAVAVFIIGGLAVLILQGQRRD